MNTPIRLMLTGGGTGGHLFPAIATAEALCDRIPGSEVLFVGTKRKMDKASLEQYGYATCSIHSRGLKGKSFFSLLQGMLVLPISCVEAIYHILRFKPHLVVGVGGYVTGPVVAAARLLGKPTLIHEQNSVPGLANRKLGSLVAKICLSLPGSEKSFPREKTVLTGNPVRKELLELAGNQTAETKKKKTLTLLVLGGSLGAHRINEIVSEAFSLGVSALKNVKVIHQTGSLDVDMVKNKYNNNHIESIVAPFFTDMAAIYKEADLLVSRAGATTLAELSVLGKPAILIPYPYAADNHQEKNGEYYVQGGGAKMFIEKNLTPELLAEQLEVLFTDPEKLKEMGKAMQERAFPKAAERIVDECLNLLKQKSKTENRKPQSHV
ncbi:MAG: undecaprenyldiphospho-muramoylpentapeptide beta-N-acetylglucosaminyltransferase [Desulfocapsa sp.]|nr:undecaprenyldiphospho-muramoylpentapeptide beta-N-acetylglucosaminyltransferase [Desulfocapsa sp.]